MIHRLFLTLRVYSILLCRLWKESKHKKDMKFAREKTSSPVRIAAQFCPYSGIGTVSNGDGLPGVRVLRDVITVNHYLLRTLPTTAHAGIFALDNKTRK